MSQEVMERHPFLWSDQLSQGQSLGLDMGPNLSPQLSALAQCPPCATSHGTLYWCIVWQGQSCCGLAGAEAQGGAHTTPPGCFPSPKPSLFGLAHLGVTFLIFGKSHH